MLMTVREDGHAVEPWTPELVGGHPAVDLVNTVSWRLDPARTVDRLAGADELRLWLRAAGLVGPEWRAGTRAGTDVLPAVRRLREVVHRLLVSVVARSRASDTDLDAMRRATVDARRHARPGPDLPLRWTVAPREPADIPRLLALSAEDLLSSGARLQTLGRCADAGCGWFFLDTSRSHTRRWCSSADCGNRERARRHYARRR
jgi:predicted RNA-binding Zn ribbon-like protein